MCAGTISAFYKIMVISIIMIIYRQHVGHPRLKNYTKAKEPLQHKHGTR